MPPPSPPPTAALVPGQVAPLVVEILPRPGSEFHVEGYPCIGPFSIAGVCRVHNTSTSVSIPLTSLEVTLKADSFGRSGAGGDVGRLPLMDAKHSIIGESQPSAVVHPKDTLQLDFCFEFAVETGSVLPPSCAVVRTDPYGDSFEGTVRYELRANFRASVSGSVNNGIVKKVFRFPRFDVKQLTSHLIELDAYNVVKGKYDGDDIKYALDLPKYLIPGDRFMISFSTRSYSRDVYSVTIELLERLDVEGLPSGVENEKLLLMVAKSPRTGSDPRRFEHATVVDVPKWSVKRGDVSVTVVAPEIVSPPLVVSHRFRVRIDVVDTPPIIVYQPVTVLAADVKHVTRLIEESVRLPRGSDPSVDFLLDGLASGGLKLLSRHISPRKSKDSGNRGRSQGPAAGQANLGVPRVAPPRRSVSPSLFPSAGPRDRSAGRLSDPYASADRGRSRDRALNGDLDEEEALLLALRRSQEEARREFEVDPDLVARLTREDTAVVVARIAAKDPPAATETAAAAIPRGADLVAPPRTRRSTPQEPLEEVQSGTPLNRGPGPITIVENAFVRVGNQLNSGPGPITIVERKLFPKSSSSSWVAPSSSAAATAATAPTQSSSSSLSLSGSSSTIPTPAASPSQTPSSVEAGASSGGLLGGLFGGGGARGAASPQPEEISVHKAGRPRARSYGEDRLTPSAAGLSPPPPPIPILASGGGGIGVGSGDGRYSPSLLGPSDGGGGARPAVRPRGASAANAVMREDLSEPRVANLNYEPLERGEIGLRKGDRVIVYQVYHGK
ncbi:hypothetical protein HK405_007102 [Cladochytrium tenue]|nr:hypothetical protein HK405_007102 [Cladochytrium tenue]